MIPRASCRTPAIMSMKTLPAVPFFPLATKKTRTASNRVFIGKARTAAEKKNKALHFTPGCCQPEDNGREFVENKIIRARCVYVCTGGGTVECFRAAGAEPGQTTEYLPGRARPERWKKLAPLTLFVNYK